MGSPTTYTSATVWSLTSRRHAESFSLISSGGAVRISHPAILIPPPIKSVTWMPSSPNWGLSKSSSSRTTPRALPPSTAPSTTPSGWPAGLVEHVLLRDADAAAAGGDLALLHARGQERREACVAAVRQLDLPPDVLVAGGEVHPRRGCQTRVRAAAVSTVRRHAECPPRLLSLERRPLAHGPVAHRKDPQAAGVQAPGPDYLWRRRLYPE